MEFPVVFSEQMELHFFFHSGNEIDWTISFDWNFRMPVGRGLGKYQCQQETSQLNFLWCFTFYRTTSKFFFLEKKAMISSFGCCSIHISSGKPAISIHIFSHDVAQADARWNPRIMQVEEKHKYRPENLIRFHLQGCSCVLKCPPTLPTSKDTHCNDKRFGNLPPSFRSLAFFLGSVTVKSLAL